MTDFEPNPAVTLTVSIRAHEPLPGEDPNTYVDYLVECVTDGLREHIVKMFEKMGEGK